MTDTNATTTRSSGPFRTRPKYVIVEKHLVREGRQAEVVAFYKERVIPVLYDFEGYLGWTALSVEQEQIPGSDDFLGVGLPDDPFQHHPSLHHPLGHGRTDLSFHLDALLHGHYNLMFEHFFETDAGIANHHAEIEDRWRARYGTDIWDDLADNYFVHFRNHWDTVFKFVDFA